MVRNYIIKTKKGLTCNKDDLQEALEEIRSGRMGRKCASKHYKIPKTTLLGHLEGRRGIKSASFSRSTALSISEER